MANARDTGLVQPYQGDPSLGNLSTPISDSAFTRGFIGSLPIYRKGLSPIARGLEIGLAHGYFLVGPETLLGPGRDNPSTAYLGALLTAVVIVTLGTIGLSSHGIVSLKSAAENPAGTDPLKTSEGWSELASGFFLGGTGGAFIAYLLLANSAGISAIFQGLIN